MNLNKFEDKSQEELLDLLGSKSRHVGFIEVLEVINQILKEDSKKNISFRLGRIGGEYELLVHGKKFQTIYAHSRIVLEMIMEVVNNAYNRGRMDVIKPVLNYVHEQNV